MEHQETLEDLYARLNAEAMAALQPVLDRISGLPIADQISELEAQLTPRRLRECVLADRASGAFVKAVDTLIRGLRGKAA